MILLSLLLEIIELRLTIEYPESDFPSRSASWMDPAQDTVPD
jgi:hypothetical protein